MKIMSYDNFYLSIKKILAEIKRGTSTVKLIWERNASF